MQEMQDLITPCKVRNKIQCATSLRASFPIWQAKQAARDVRRSGGAVAKGKKLFFFPLALMSLCVTSPDYLK